MRSDAAQQAGMTLIEVLVALTIVAVTLSAGFKAAGGLVLNAQRVADLTLAQWCAENRLTGINLSGRVPGVGDGEFQCNQLGRDFVGKQMVRPTLNPNMPRIDVQILDEAGLPIVKITTVQSK